MMKIGEKTRKNFKLSKSFTAMKTIPTKPKDTSKALVQKQNYAAIRFKTLKILAHIEEEGFEIQTYIKYIKMANQLIIVESINSHWKNETHCLSLSVMQSTQLESKSSQTGPSNSLSHSQIKQAIKQLSSKYTFEKIDQAITYIHNQILNNSCKHVFHKQLISANTSPLQKEINNEYSKASNFESSVVKKEIRELSVSLGENKVTGEDESNKKFMEERELALIFLSQGYGLNTIKACIFFPCEDKEELLMTPNQYNNGITSIAKTTFRKLEDFLRRERKTHIHPLTSNQEKILRAPLVNSKKWLHPQMQETLRKFYAYTYKIPTKYEFISLQEAKDLYAILIDLMQKRQARNSQEGTKKFKRM